MIESTTGPVRGDLQPHEVSALASFCSLISYLERNDEGLRGGLSEGRFLNVCSPVVIPFEPDLPYGSTCFNERVRAPVLAAADAYAPKKRTVKEVMTLMRASWEMLLRNWTSLRPEDLDAGSRALALLQAERLAQESLRNAGLAELADVDRLLALKPPAMHPQQWESIVHRARADRYQEFVQDLQRLFDSNRTNPRVTLPVLEARLREEPN